MTAGDKEVPGEPGGETLAEEVVTTEEEEDFGEFVASDTTVAGKLLLTWMKRKEAVVYALVGHHLFQKQYIVALQWMNQLLARLVEVLYVMFTYKFRWLKIVGSFQNIDFMSMSPLC